MSVIEREAPVVETPAVADSPSQILEAAAEYIERNGWFGRDGKIVRGYSINPQAAACAAVAMLRVSEGDGPNSETLGDDQDFSEAWDRLERLAQGQGYTGIFRWNDAPERTPQEVCRALREAAAKPS